MLSKRVLFLALCGASSGLKFLSEKELVKEEDSAPKEEYPDVDPDDGAAQFLKKLYELGNQAAGEKVTYEDMTKHLAAILELKVEKDGKITIPEDFFKNTISYVKKALKIKEDKKDDKKKKGDDTKEDDKTSKKEDHEQESSDKKEEVELGPKMKEMLTKVLDMLKRLEKFNEKVAKASDEEKKSWTSKEFDMTKCIIALNKSGDMEKTLALCIDAAVEVNKTNVEKKFKEECDELEDEKAKEECLAKVGKKADEELEEVTKIAKEVTLPALKAAWKKLEAEALKKDEKFAAFAEANMEKPADNSGGLAWWAWLLISLAIVAVIGVAVWFFMCRASGDSDEESQPLKDGSESE